VYEKGYSSPRQPQRNPRTFYSIFFRYWALPRPHPCQQTQPRLVNPIQNLPSVRVRGFHGGGACRQTLERREELIHLPTRNETRETKKMARCSKVLRPLQSLIWALKKVVLRPMLSDAIKKPIKRCGADTPVRRLWEPRRLFRLPM
jgi:hypothetical protein